MTYLINYPNHLQQNHIELFYYLCAVTVREQSTSCEVSIIKNRELVCYLVEDKDKPKYIRKIMDKLMSVTGTVDLGAEGKRVFNFFAKYQVNERKHIFAYELTLDAYQIVEDFVRSNNPEELATAISLSGKYTSKVWQVLNQVKNAGYLKLGVYELYDLLDVPYDYPHAELVRTILKPAFRRIEQADLLGDIQCRFTKEGFGREAFISGIVITWKINNVSRENMGVESL